MAAKNVACPSCGFAKNPPGSARCVSCGNKIEAIKVFREATGCSLLEAKDAVERIV